MAGELTAVLEGKNILVISPQPWGRMFVSKHHYAVELCRRGNRVWFLEPARESGPMAPHVRTVEEIPGLQLVSRRTFIPRLVRFKARPLYDVLVALEARLLLLALGVRFDIVWSFELNLYSDLGVFRADLRIFHAVDQVATASQIAAGRSADVVFSVAENILDRFGGVAAPRHFINHGLGAEFVRAAEERGSEWAAHDGAIRVGYVGNLFIPQLDRGAFQRMVEENPGVDFHVWGPREASESNVAAADSIESRAFVRFLRERSNVRLRGVAPSAELAPALYEMDAFLLCYDPVMDPAGGSNSHKILEYLSTGRVVVANHVSTYASRDDLLRMAEPGDNRRLASVFRETMADLARHNAPEATGTRARFALDLAYERHVARIDGILTELISRRKSTRVTPVGVAPRKEVA